MDRNDTKIQIEELIQNKLFLDLCMNKAEELFGDAVINGDMFRAAYTAIDQVIKLITMTSEPAVDLGWYVWENDSGRFGLQAGVGDEMREIRTVEDLLDLAEMDA